MGFAYPGQERVVFAFGASSWLMLAHFLLLRASWAFSFASWAYVGSLGSFFGPLGVVLEVLATVWGRF